MTIPYTASKFQDFFCVRHSFAFSIITIKDCFMFISLSRRDLKKKENAPFQVSIHNVSSVPVVSYLLNETPDYGGWAVIRSPAWVSQSDHAQSVPFPLGKANHVWLRGHLSAQPGQINPVFFSLFSVAVISHQSETLREIDRRNARLTIRLCHLFNPSPAHPLYSSFPLTIKLSQNILMFFSK